MRVEKWLLLYGFIAFYHVGELKICILHWRRLKVYCRDWKFCTKNLRFNKKWYHFLISNYVYEKEVMQNNISKNRFRQLLCHQFIYWYKFLAFETSWLRIFCYFFTAKIFNELEIWSDSRENTVVSNFLLWKNSCNLNRFNLQKSSLNSQILSPRK